MNPEAVKALEGLVWVFAILFIVWAVLWTILPFIVLSINNHSKQAVQELRAIHARLSRLESKNEDAVTVIKPPVAGRLHNSHRT